MHELSHVYHYFVVENGFRNDIVNRMFENIVQDGRYEKVMRQNYHRKKDWDDEKGEAVLNRAYCLNGADEYFASLSVPFFGFVNDWYPFERQDLEKFDMGGVKMLQTVWESPGESPGVKD